MSPCVCAFSRACPYNQHPSICSVDTDTQCGHTHTHTNTQADDRETQHSWPLTFSELLKCSGKRSLYTAGGGLASSFGIAPSHVWLKVFVRHTNSSSPRQTACLYSHHWRVPIPIAQPCVLYTDHKASSYSSSPPQGRRPFLTIALSQRRRQLQC